MKLTPEDAERLGQALDVLYDMVLDATDPSAATMIRVPEKLMAQIDEVCQKTGFTRADVVGRAVDMFLDEYRQAAGV